MQEQIFRVGSAASQQQRLQQQQQNQMRSIQVLGNTPANQIVARRQTQHQQTKIVTPNKSAQYELLAVKEVFYQVEEAFRAREKEKTKLQDQVSEKENQIKYCEEQTKRQSEAIGILTASNSYRNHKISQLSDDINHFNDDMVEPLKDRCSDVDEKLFEGIKMLVVMEQDLKPLRTLALNQQHVASELSADFDAAEMRVQLKVASLKQLKARNSILEAAIKAQHEELDKLKEERKETEQEYSDAEQNYHKVQIKDTALKKVLDAAEVECLKMMSTQIDDVASQQEEILSAKEALKSIEMKTQKIQSETVELTVQVACAKSHHTSVCAQISKAALEKELIRTKHIETNDRMSNFVLERKKAVVLCEGAKIKGDHLKEEVLTSRESLEQTVERVKEYERNMQENYSLMSQKMTEQYSLQKLEPGLRCELFQLEELLRNRIRDLRIIADSTIKQTEEEEKRVFTLQAEIKESLNKADTLENYLAEERKIFSSKNIIMRELETELKLLLLKEDESRADWKRCEAQTNAFEDLKGEIITLQSHLEKRIKVVDTLKKENEEIEMKIVHEAILIASGDQSWKPSESLEAKVESTVKNEEPLMIQILESEFQKKELEIKQQIAKLKGGFLTPAAWLEKADNMRSKILAGEVHNKCVERELITANKNLSTLKACKIKKDDENKVLNEHISSISGSTAVCTVEANSTSLLVIPDQEHSPYSLLVDLEESNEENLKSCDDGPARGRNFSQGHNIGHLETESILDKTCCHEHYLDINQGTSGQGPRVQRSLLDQRNHRRQNKRSVQSLKVTSTAVLPTEAPSRKKLVKEDLVKFSQSYCSQSREDYSNYDMSELSQTRLISRPSVANSDQRLRGTNRRKEQEIMQVPDEGPRSDDDIVSKITAKDNMEEESGWITESSVCFEDTLFGESSPKKIGVFQRGKSPISKSTKGAPAFGGRRNIAAGTTSRNFGFNGDVVDNKPLHETMHKNFGTLKRKHLSGEKSISGKEDQAEKKEIAIAEVSAINDKSRSIRLSTSINQTALKDRGSTNRVPDRGNFDKGLMAPPSLPSMNNQQKTSAYDNELQDVATTKNKKNFEAMTTVKRKPLSSVGLAGANLITKMGKDSGNKGAKINSKSALQGTQYRPTARPSDDKISPSQFSTSPSGKKKVTRSIPKLDEGIRGPPKSSKGKTGSPGDWFDDDIRF